jgi:subfamily B ATP-binding cassette protein MsbA
VREHVRPHLGRIAFSLVCMAIAAAATAAMAKIMEPMLDDIFKDRDFDALHNIAMIILAVFVTKGFATYGQAVAMSYVGQRILADIQIRMFSHLIHSDLSFFHNNSTGQLISRFTNDVNMMRSAVSTALTGIGKDFLTVVFLIAVMFYQDWFLAVLTFFVFPTAVLPIIRIGRRMRKVSANTQVEMGHFTTLLDESFQGARHVKAYGMEEYETGRARAAIDQIFSLIYKAARTRSVAHPIMETLGGVAIVAVMFYGGYQVLDGAKTPGAFFSFITALLLAYEPVKKLAYLNSNLQEGLAAAERVFTLLDTAPKITDKPDARPLSIVRGAIRFEDVHFAYTPGQPALDGVTLDVPAGKTAALVGPSGAGKSTILNLIPRFYDVDGGSVSIDGNDIRDVTLASLRAGMGLVSQEISLFDDSVRANIAYGRTSASEAEIEQAARQAAAHDFIVKLPQGYDTQVGGQGAKLSGGQRQRLAIARAMLKNAPVLLLDEATSALDTESERQVQSALAELMQGRTTLVIAHRLSTVVDADIIYVVEDGRVSESGSHEELIARGGAYARLYALQLKGKSSAEIDTSTGGEPQAEAADEPTSVVREASA